LGINQQNGGNPDSVNGAGEEALEQKKSPFDGSPIHQPKEEGSLSRPQQKSQGGKKKEHRKKENGFPEKKRASPAKRGKNKGVGGNAVSARIESRNPTSLNTASTGESSSNSQKKENSEKLANK